MGSIRTTKNKEDWKTDTRKSTKMKLKRTNIGNLKKKLMCIKYKYIHIKKKQFFIVVQHAHVTNFTILTTFKCVIQHH